MKIKRTKPGSKSSEAKHEIVKSEQNGNAAAAAAAAAATGSIAAPGLVLGASVTTGGPASSALINASDVPSIGDGVGVGNNKKFVGAGSGSGGSTTGNNNNSTQAAVPAASAIGGGGGGVGTAQNSSMVANNNNNSNNNNNNSNTSNNHGGNLSNSTGPGGNAQGTNTASTGQASMTGGGAPVVAAAGGCTGVASSTTASSSSNKRNSSGHRRDKGKGEKGPGGSTSTPTSVGSISSQRGDKGSGATTAEGEKSILSGNNLPGGATSGAAVRVGVLCTCPESTAVAHQNGSSLTGPPCGSTLCGRLRGVAGGSESKVAGSVGAADQHDRTGGGGGGAVTEAKTGGSLNSDLMADRGSSSPPAKKMRGEPREMHDACVGTSVGTITEPDCLGPCEPGTSVTLEGIVWHETEGGVLVVNVTWRGKTYVGTLLDCTRHDWAPPR